MTDTTSPSTLRGLALTVRGLSAGYGGPPVLHDLSLHIDAGETVALLGSNGAGKSTLARALTGFAQVSSGTITLGDAPLIGRPAHLITRAGLAHVPEGRHLFSALSVEENLWLPQQWQRLPDEEFRQRLDDVYRRFPRLDDRRNQRAGSLSGGEQQMLAIARALLLQPRLLLLDEPSTGLAPLLVAEIFDIVRTLKRELGVSMLLIEQNAVGALEVSERAYVLQRGRVVAEGPSAELARDESIRAHYLGG